MILTKVISHVPSVVQASALTEKAMNLYNITEPAAAIRTVGLKILDFCLPPNIKYPVRCSLFATQLIFALSTSGSPWSVAMVFALARQIIEAE